MLQTTHLQIATAADPSGCPKNPPPLQWLCRELFRSDLRGRPSRIWLFCASCCFWLGSAPILQAHDHLAAGALSTDPGSSLIFVNAADFSAESGFVFGLDLSPGTDPYAGYYTSEDFAFTALAATPNDGGPEPLHAALGAYIEIVLETLDGPTGGALGFWEVPPANATTTNLTWTVPVGLSNGTNQFAVSESDGSPGSDPYGHLHGRVFGVTQPGLYRAGFRFVDRSTNGPNGGPIHSPSELFHLYLQADLSVGSITSSTNGINLMFAALSDLPDSGDGPAAIYSIESSPALGLKANWQALIEGLAGDDHVHTVSTPVTATPRFFRLRKE